MFETYSFDKIMDRMLSNVSSRFDKREGSGGISVRTP